MMKYLILILGVVYLINADDLTISSRYDCNSEYTMAEGISYDLKYKGEALGLEKCSIQFSLLDSSDVMICYKPSYIRMDCGTIIEFQEHFVAENIHDGRLTCDMNNVKEFNETCLKYVSKFFIVIKTQSPYGSTSDYNVIHVYTKENSRFGFDTGDTVYYTMLAAVVPITVIIICVIACAMRYRRRQQLHGGTQVTYNTAVCATNVQTGGSASSQPMLPYSGNQPVSAHGYHYPGQQPAGAYHVHPTVMAYPTGQTQPTAGPYISTNQPFPSSQYGGTHVSHPEKPSDRDNDDITPVWMMFIYASPCVIMIFITVIICWVRYRQHHRQELMKNTQITYNVPVGTATMQAGGNTYTEVAPSQQTLLPWSEMQQSMSSSTSTNQYGGGQQSTEGCIVHPMVTAYPAHYPPASGVYQPVPQHGDTQTPSLVNPSAPHQEHASQNPPSYENILKE